MTTEEILKQLEARNDARHQSLVMAVLAAAGMTQEQATIAAEQLSNAIKSDFPVEGWEE